MPPDAEQWPTTLRVALIQMHPEPLQPELNFATAASHIKAAAAQGAKLAVLPEYHLCGWQPEDLKFASHAAEANEFVSRYQEMAKQYRINIVPGTIVMASPTKGVTGRAPLLNKSFFISDRGEILGEYTKTNLWHPERDHLTSGPDHGKIHWRRSESVGETTNGEQEQQRQQPPHEVIQTPLGPVGLLICYDLAFPEASRALVRAGARIIIIPTFTKSDDMSPIARSYNAHGEALFVQSALVSRAFENTCCMIFCNVGGPAEEGYMGLSQVTLPIVGTVKGSFIDAQEGSKVVDVDMKVVDIAEENYKIRGDLQREGFHYR